jgi:ATP phosphoribosyltransferase regulatory subunit HisZ
VLDDYELMPYISIDLGMLQSINYYTGIIFKGFTYGLGFPLFSGGRYNGAVAAFGRDLSATGFSIGINFVMSALRRQGLIEQRKQDIVRLLYPDNLRKAAYTAADRWRRDGFRIVCEKISSENNMFPKNEGIVSDTSAESLESAFAGIENYESVIVIMEKQDKIRIYCKEC